MELSLDLFFSDILQGYLSQLQYLSRDEIVLTQYLIAMFPLVRFVEEAPCLYLSMHTVHLTLRTVTPGALLAPGEERPPVTCIGTRPPVLHL